MIMMMKKALLSSFTHIMIIADRFYSHERGYNKNVKRRHCKDNADNFQRNIHTKNYK